MEIRPIEKNEYVKYSQELNAHIMQSFTWGEVKKPQWSPLRFGVFEGDEIISVITILTRKVPLLGRGIGYIPRGIALKGLKYLPEVLELVKQEANKMLCLLIDPDTPFDQDIDKKELGNIFRNNGFKVVGRTLQPLRTVALALSKSEDELLSDMRSKHRQYIRKAIRNGVKIRQGKRHDLDTFYEILQEISQEKRYEIHTKEYHKRVFELFAQENKTALFIAEVDGEIVGSFMVFFYNDTAYEMYGGCGERGKKLLANYPLKWESIKYAKRIGIKFYDQWGAEFIYPGLVQFKEGFGGKIVEYLPQYGYSPSPFGLKIYKVMMSGVVLIRKIVTR